MEKDHSSIRIALSCCLLMILVASNYLGTAILMSFLNKLKLNRASLYLEYRNQDLEINSTRLPLIRKPIILHSDDKDVIYPHTSPYGHSENAIFTLLAGINPYESPSVKNYVCYLGYLIHLAAVRFLLDVSGSTMDFNILFRIHYGLPNNTLPLTQLKFFSKLRMNIIFIPQKVDGSWKSFTMEKFHVLRFHEYKRIFFIDADVLPLCDMSHYFSMSDQGVFAPNVIFAFNHEPSNAGLFLVSPERDDWEIFNNISDYINPKMGFGIPLSEPAEGMKCTYSDWSWQAVKEDQGMLYHWTRYVKKNVTMVNENRLKTWVDVNGTVKLVREVRRFRKRCPISIDSRRASVVNHLALRDFNHFTGRNKPWKLFNWSSEVANETELHKINLIPLWGYAVWKAWKVYDLGPLNTLIPNLSDELLEDVNTIQRFLDRTGP
jgi:hypothetical protein